ncbi:hypothetical protein PHYPSEUDO_010826 [Phytophthora pseudosyringae]|uniref:RxLR effector PexRD54 WY domain-containing protein n=1 Tax=Phytophthora pseudosyringae TaxID=221518 RepID=A0A8T1W956_9STRA|nr:hypothetical protein PHYPSEUDO_010826 [Phytophthora pseudosyringae]
MRLPRVLLLAAVALVASADAASSHVTIPDGRGLAHSPMDKWHGTKRFLRIHESDDEERAISSPSVEMLQGWLKKGLISGGAVELLSLGNKADDLLTGSLLNAWVSYVKVFNKENPTEKMSMIKTLTTRFEDEALSTMIETSKRSAKTAAIANKVQGKQFQYWAGAGRTPDDIFALLKLNTAKSLLFDQPPVATWLKYMDDFSKSNAGSHFSAVATLRKYYSDEALAKMIAVAAKSPKTSDAAKRVETELLRSWFNSMKSQTDIVRLLNLHKAGLQASKSPLFPIWTKYVDLFNKVDPRFKMEMLQDWLKKGLITDDTFVLLTLGKAADEHLNGSLLSAWASYIKVFNKENPTEKMSLLATLTARFGDEAVSTMIEAAKKVPKSASIANSVQSEQIQHWLTTGKLPDDIFVLLKLNTAKTRLFDQPQLNTWVKYVDEFNEANSKIKTSLFSALATRYSEATLAQMLVVAKKTSGSESLAIRIQAEQTQFWLRADKLPDDVYRMLKLNKLGTTFLNSPIFVAWVKYTDEFRKINPGTKLTTVATLRNYYTDKTLVSLFIKASESTKTASIGKRLQTEMLREWYITVTPPVHVFKLLSLQKTGLKVFESPLYTVWTNYIAFVKKADNSFKGDLLTMLRRNYGDEMLSNVLIAAGRVQGTTDTAQKLQKELFGLWRAAKVHPTSVYNMLHVERVSNNSPTRAFFSEYIKAYAKA